MLGPIFAREWLTVPRRSRHYVVRSAYLGLLWVLGLTAWQATVGWNRSASLGDTARFGALLFQFLTYVQLTLVLFFTALSAASAVAQEKDRRTFILLLLTAMRNHEIVLGKLLGSLLQIVLLLAGTVPVLALVMLLGGVAPEQIGKAILIMAATGLAAGSLGCLVALWREQTFQILALTVLFLVLYLCLVRALAFVPALEEWQFYLDPFQVLQTVLASGQHRWAAYFFAGVMVLGSICLNAVAILRLRVWNPRGEPIMQREKPEEADKDDLKARTQVHAAPGKVRAVWPNPILWREIRTRAYGRRPLLVKTAYFLVLGLICYPLFTGNTGKHSFAAAQGLVPVAILSLILIGAQAVTALTSEKDANALDLLLVTDLSPGEFIFGKLWGICWNAKEFLLPPLILTIVYACHGALATPPKSQPNLEVSRNIQAAACILGTLIVLMAFTTVLGVHVGLRAENGRVAVIHTLGTIFFLSVGTLICIYLIVINGRFEYQWGSFVFFIAAGIGGLWWVLNGDRPSKALTFASWVCPFAMVYSVMNVLIGKAGTAESSQPIMPALVVAFAFGFSVAAMLVPLLSEFDLAMGRTGGGNE